MKTIILDTSYSTPAYFKGFKTNGGIHFTHNIEEALNIASFERTTNQKIVKRMLSAWYGKPFSQLGFEVWNVSYLNEVC